MCVGGGGGMVVMKKSKSGFHLRFMSLMTGDRLITVV